ncbi:uncharacterized protein LOC132592660 [Zootoca vivipara]|uniref:uncharacterized protein LOC132592660 n=1 Tax=Zootoca vivipara TaxID=8524 RepID=UPI00293BF5CA|nr:uncharacterized protein LOC132592660 [Zootoca vivipara]
MADGSAAPQMPAPAKDRRSKTAQAARSKNPAASVRVRTIRASLAADPQALAQFDADFDALIQRSAASAPSTSTAVQSAAVQPSAAAGPQVSQAPPNLVLSESSSPPLSSSDLDDIVPPSGIPVPAPPVAPLLAAPAAQGKGKQPLKPGKSGPKGAGAKGPTQVAQAGGADGAGGSVSPLMFSQPAVAASRQIQHTSSSDGDPLPVPAKVSRGGKRHKKRRSTKRSKRRKEDSTTTSSSGPEEVRIWIVGHSIVHWAGDHAAKSTLGLQLGLPPHVRLTWMGRRGMRWGELLPLLRREVFALGFPTALVLQLGENDLPDVDSLSLRLAMESDLTHLRTLMPGVTVIWSQLLQRIEWKGSLCPAATEKARKRVNNAISKLVLELGGSVISHPDITFKATSLFRPDGVHLSPVGNDTWLRDVSEGLKRWLGL